MVKKRLTKNQRKIKRIQSKEFRTETQTPAPTAETGGNGSTQPTAVFFIPNDEEKQELIEMFKRLGNVLRVFSVYMNLICELDENAPDFMDKIGDPLEKLTLGIMATYPEGGQFDADLKTIQQILAMTQTAETNADLLQKTPCVFCDFEVLNLAEVCPACHYSKAFNFPPELIEDIKQKARELQKIGTASFESILQSIFKLMLQGIEDKKQKEE